jgi:hypothetical protein
MRCSKVVPDFGRPKQKNRVSDADKFDEDIRNHVLKI